MALIHTPDAEKDLQAPDFKLKATDDSFYTRDQVMGDNGLVVMFICNHCPYVKAVIDRLVADCKILQEKYAVGCVAIMPNDTVNYPADSFENMKLFARNHGFTFPYVIDETQKIAKAYDAVCTPDIFGFDKNGKLAYRGRVDSAGAKDADENTQRELLEAMISVAENGTAPEVQHSSMGCSIKWKQ